MIEEADEFALNLSSMKKTLSDYSNATNGELDSTFIQYVMWVKAVSHTEILAATKTACGASLPRVWAFDSDDLTGRAVPTRHQLSAINPTVVGGDCDLGLVEDSIQILAVRSVKIIAPLDDWIMTHQHVKERIARLEKLGHQIETSQNSKKLSSMFNKKRRQERDIEEGGSVFSATTAAGDEIKSEERRHEALVQMFDETEKSIAEQLTALIIDSSYCKSVVLSLLIAIKESVQASLIGLGPSKQPLPGYGSTFEHGEVLSNDELIQSMSVVNDSMGKADPSRSALATRMVTSSPLQIATSAAPTPRYALIDTAMPLAHKLELIEKEYHRTD